MSTEPWLRGPVAGIDELLMPAAHALLQAREDIARVALPIPLQDLWLRPGGAASAGFHLVHIAGSIDRLLTYARGAPLTDTQRDTLASEQQETDSTVQELVERAIGAIDGALAEIAATPRARLLEPREVGRAKLPSNVLGLLFHVAEHTQRHVGQLIATARCVATE